MFFTANPYHAVINLSIVFGFALVSAIVVIALGDLIVDGIMKIQTNYRKAHMIHLVNTGQLTSKALVLFE